MTYGSNGSVVGPDNVPTASVASGVWSMGEVAEARRDGIWPMPTDGYIMSLVKPDGDTSNNPYWYLYMVAPFPTADAQMYLQGYISNSAVPAPTNWVTQLTIDDTDLTVVSGSEKRLQTTSPAAHSQTPSSVVGRVYVDSNSDMYGALKQGDISGSYSFQNAVFYKTDSNNTLTWRAVAYHSNVNIGNSCWYQVDNGTYGLCQFDYPSNQPGHNGSRTAIARMNITDSASSGSWPQDYYYTGNSREASYDPWSTVTGYQPAVNNSGDAYGCYSGYSGGVQSGLIVKWYGPGSSTSPAWNRFGSASGGGTLLLQASVPKSYDDSVTFGGYRSSGNPYPLWVTQLSSSGSVVWQTEWAHGTANNYLWGPYGMEQDSSGNTYILGYWADTTDTGNSQNRPTIIKVNSSGVTQWIASCTPTISGVTAYTVPMNIALTSDGGLMMSIYANAPSGTTIPQNIFFKFNDLDSPAGKVGNINTTISDWSFTWADTTSLFTASTPSHTWATWSYISQSTSFSGVNFGWQTTQGTPTFTSMTSTQVTGGAF